MTSKKYSWNRNTAHHRIALTRFAVVAMILATFVSLLMVLAMGIKSDGSRGYVTTTAILGLLSFIVTWTVFFSFMGSMYRWLCDEDRQGKLSESIPPTLPKKEVMWQDVDGNWWSNTRHKRVG